MMRSLAPWTKFWLAGGVLVFLGFGIPLFTVLDIIPANLFLLCGSAVASMIGMFLGYYAMALYVRVHRRRPPGR